MSARKAWCVVALVAWGHPALAGCEKDTDCKGDRICAEDGQCSEPVEAPTPVGTAIELPIHRPCERDFDCEVDQWCSFPPGLDLGSCVVSTIDVSEAGERAEREYQRWQRRRNTAQGLWAGSAALVVGGSALVVVGSLDAVNNPEKATGGGQLAAAGWGTVSGGLILTVPATVMSIIAGVTRPVHSGGGLSVMVTPTGIAGTF